MMKKLILSVMAWAIIIWCAGAAIAATEVEQKLKAAFPDVDFTSVTKSPVKGLYEVVWGEKILYFAPQENILIAGQMFDKTKRNLTAERLQGIVAKSYQNISQKAKDLPLDKAVKTGNGKHVVIEFTDPDCPFCRQAAAFFESRTDVTKYTFFTPLPMHPDALNKVRYILCQKDRGKAFDEVMKGKIDGQKYETCADAEVNELIKSHDSASIKMGISSTPFFIIDGKVVSGADIPKIENLLNEKVIDAKDKK
jgi:thiol:disulfide interchange protein DsbC